MARRSVNFSIHKLSYKTLFSIVFFLLIGIVALLKFIPHTKISAAWWNDSWNYRKSISISNTSGSNLTNFQISFSIGTSAMVNANKIQSDCDDIRVTDINGNLLPFWIETNTCNTDSTVIWTKVPSLPTSGSIVYIYYGNPVANSVSDSSVLAKSCSNINAYLGDGLYYIDPDGKDSLSPFQAYCDMTSNGGGWSLVASWNTAQEWTKTSTSTSTVFGTTAKDAVSSNFGNVRLNDFRILASDTVTVGGTNAYADWYYHYNTSTSWKEVWAPSANLGGNISNGYRSTSPRQALKPFNYSYNLKFSYQVTQTWNNLSDWSYTGAVSAGCLPNYWNALTSPGNPFGVYSLAYYSGSGGVGCASPVSDGTLGICPSDQANCITGQDRTINNVKIGYDDGTACAGFGVGSTANLGEQPGVQATTKLWWFIREGTPINNSFSIGSLSSEETGGGPIASWKFDEGNGNTANDTSSGGNNGIITGAVWQSEDQCISGKCLYFNSDDKVQINDNQSFDVDTMTIEMWLKLTDTGQWFAIYRADNTGNMWYFYNDSSNGAEFTWYTNGVRHELHPQSPNINQWHHYAIIISPNFQQVYRDGKLSASDTIADGLTATNGAIKLGEYGSPGNYNLTGFMDGVQIYNYARTPSQIKSDYTAGKFHTSSSSTKGTSANLGAPKSSGEFLSEGLVGYWKMDEGVGTTTLDSSGNNNTGTFVGSPAWSSGKYGVGISFPINSYLNLGTTILNTNIWTINTQVKYINQARQFEFFLGNNDSTTGKILLRHNGYVSFYANNSTYYDFSTPSTALEGNLKNISFVSNGTKISLYIDGLFQSSITPPSTSLIIKTINNGWSDNVWTTNCVIDEFRAYNRALSPTEVSQLYNWSPPPVAYWNFDEGIGSSLSDNSSNGYGGNLASGNSSPSWTTGKYGSALDFTDNDYVDINDSGATSKTSNLYAATYSFWIYPRALMSSASNDQRLIEKRDNSISSSINTSGYITSSFTYTASPDYQNDSWTSSHRLGFYNSGTDQWTTADLNKWYYITIIFDSTTNKGKTYINGILDRDYTLVTGAGRATGIVTPGINTQLGRYHWGVSNFYNGKMDDLKIYNYARTPKQIIEDMNAGHPVGGSPVGSQVGYWKLEEGYGTVINNSGNGGPTLNGNFGPGTSAPVWTNDGKFGKALNFNGTTTYIDSTSNNHAFNITNNLTASVWVKPNTHTGNDEYIVGHYYQYGIHLGSTGLFKMLIRDSNGNYYYPSSGVYPPLNQWSQLAATFKDGLLNFYMNGNKISSSTIPTTDLYNSANDTFTIGSYFNSGRTYNYNGLIDEIKIYSSALTDEEIKLDYNRNSSLQMGGLSTGAGNTAPATAASQEYCIPGDNTVCSPPIARWNFEEGVGATAFDSSGNNNNALFVNSPTWSTGKNGNGINFIKESNQYLQVDSAKESNFDLTSAITIESWINMSSNDSYGGVISKTQSNTNGWEIRTNSTPGGIQCRILNGVDLGPQTTISLNQWHHIACTYSTSDNIIRLFVDGQIGSTAVGSNGISTNDQSLLIGGLGYSPSLNMSGKVDQVSIFNYARTPQEIAFDYNRGGPIGWWKLDECQGTIVNDSSGVGNTGLITVGAGGSQNSLGTCAVGTSAVWTNGANGKYNGSLNFDGTDDYVNGPFPAIGIAKPFTMSVWFKTSAAITNTPGIASLGYMPVIVMQNDGTLRAWWYNGTSWPGIQTTKSYNNGVFHQAILTYNGTTAKLYVDGVFQSSLDSSINAIYSGFYIGQEHNSGTKVFTGQIDDYRVYNYALNTTQIKTLYNNGAVYFGN